MPHSAAQKQALLECRDQSLDLVEPADKIQASRKERLRITSNPRIPIIDAHLDLAWNAISFNRDLTLPVDEVRLAESALDDHPARRGGTVTLPELRRAGVAVCVATLLARAGSAPANPSRRGLRTDLDYASSSIAHAVAQGQLSYYRLLESQGLVSVIQDRSGLQEHWDRWRSKPDSTPTGILVGMEGTDPIVAPDQVEQWWRSGLRVAGLVHYGHGRYACGTGADGPLTVAGRELLVHFKRLGIALDATHLCDRSLDEALDLFDGSIFASHHNCRALVPGERQLADRHILELICRGGVIGTALDAWMLYPGWVRGVTDRQVVGLAAVADHIDHVCQLAGDASHAAIGSDLDGGFGIEQCPRELDTIADLGKIAGILAARGYSDSNLDSVFHGNWLRFFLDALPAK